MRHGAGAHLTLLDLLLEIVHGDIHPEVAVKVDDDGVDTTHGIEDGSQPVVVGDLSGVLLTLETELLANKLITELAPVILRIGYMMGIEVASSTTELGSDGRLLQSAQLFLKTVDIDHNLLAETCRRGRLPVGLGEHRNGLPLLGVVVKLFDQLFNEGIVDLLQSLLDREGHAGIVDILRGQAEVDELSELRIGH